MYVPLLHESQGPATVTTCVHVPVYLQEVLEPLDGLAESLLLSPLLVRITEISANRESMHDTAVKVYLPPLAGLNECVLRLMAELGSEDAIGFYP